MHRNVAYSLRSNHPPNVPFIITECFKSTISCRKQPPNLERLLCKTTYTNNAKIKVSKCGKNCVKEGTEFKFKYRDIPFKVKSPFNCNTSNLLYVITCPGCNEEYIGQTGRTLRERESCTL